MMLISFKREKNIINVGFMLVPTNTKKALHFCKACVIKWSHLDSNQGPPDYESGALTN
jgi:hypothetical protein